MTYCNALKLFSSAPHSESEAADRLRLLLSCLGNPERRLRIIPVAGEKGKSSVARMLAGMMAASDIPSASVIYPCLPTPKDNVFIGDRTLTNEEFVTHTSALALAVKSAKERLSELTGTPESTDFTKDELLFCLALTVAAASGARWLILEIPNHPFPPFSAVRFSSELMIITACGESVRPGIVSMIHPALSETVAARPTHPSAFRALSNACARAGCRRTVPLLSELSILESSLKRTVFVYRKKTYTIPLYGEHSVANALCAIEAAAALRRHKCPITDEGIERGLASSVLPARAEILSVSPTVLTDAASDPFSAEALCALLKQKGTAIGTEITLCVAEDFEIPKAFSALSDSGFHTRSTVRVPTGKENRTAVLLLKAAHEGDLILAVGALPFAHTMRNEFMKVLRSM